MKTQIKKIIFVIFLITLTFSCSKNEDVDSTPPGILSNISVVPTNGGGIISYSLPSDNDISYVRAEYTNSQGEEVFRVSSSYNTSVEINGLNQTTPIKVRLYVIDENENISDEVEVEFTPLESFIYLVQQSIEISPDLGGVKITWENIATKTVFVYVHILNGTDETIRILSSDNADSYRTAVCFWSYLSKLYNLLVSDIWTGSRPGSAGSRPKLPVITIGPAHFRMSG